MAKNPPKSATKPPLVSALDREALDYRLKLTLLQLGTLYQDAGGEMSEYIFKQYLPMQVLICALNSGMVEPPYGSWNLSELENKPSEDVVAWYDEFLAFLPVDDCYQEWLEADIWERPTPAQILKRFRIASKLTNERIAEVNKISLKTLERLITRERLGMRMSNATKLLTFMKSWVQLHAKTNAIPVEEVAYFTKLTEVELYWRSKKQA
ncbi:MAG TPA: hypothetical protein VKX39_14780 [Bryobacteraceae bacterium]|nr:hypothetical protein [Bryobacteraceae bacterium]